MTVDRVHVALGESLLPVGTLHFEARRDKQISTFHYADAWLEADHAFALAPTRKACPHSTPNCQFGGGVKVPSPVE